MRVGLSIEGKHDSSVLNVLLNRFAGKAINLEPRIHNSYGNLVKTVHQDLIEFNALGIKLVVIVADNDRSGRNSRKKALQVAVGKMTVGQLAVIGVAIEALEAWLLCDESALSHVAGKKILAQKKSAEIKWPKDHLCGLISWRTLGPSYQEVLANIANRMDFDLAKKKSRSFLNFHDDFCKAWDEMKLKKIVNK